MFARLIDRYLSDPDTHKLAQIFMPDHGAAMLALPKHVRDCIAAVERFDATDTSRQIEIARLVSYGRGGCIVSAGRAILLRRDHAMCDQIIDAVFASSSNRAMHKLIFRLRFDLGASSINSLLEAVLRLGHPAAGNIVPDCLRFIWKQSGPDASQLEFYRNLLKSPVSSKRLQQECLALALRLEDYGAVQDLLHSYPSLCGSYKRVLPLAQYMLSNRRLRTLAFYRGAASFSQLHEAIREGTREMEERLSNKGNNIAIVGNSPCEAGCGKGKLIDNHDIVIRFNAYTCDSPHLADYGERATIHARRVLNNPAFNNNSVQVGNCLLVGNDLVYLNRSWRHLLRLSSRGLKLAEVPANIYRQLQTRLKSEPSAGLAVCAYIAQLRGRLPRSSLFGFAFTDQLALDRPAHYFDSQPANHVHAWSKEAEHFVSLING